MTRSTIINHHPPLSIIFHHTPPSSAIIHNNPTSFFVIQHNPSTCILQLVYHPRTEVRGTRYEVRGHLRSSPITDQHPPMVMIIFIIILTITSHPSPSIIYDHPSWSIIAHVRHYQPSVTIIPYHLSPSATRRSRMNASSFTSWSSVLMIIMIMDDGDHHPTWFAITQHHWSTQRVHFITRAERALVLSSPLYNPFARSAGIFCLYFSESWEISEIFKENCKILLKKRHAGWLSVKWPPLPVES